MMGGVVSIFMGLFGILWTIIAIGIGGGLFALFGLFFVGIAIAQAVYNFKNATGENRYSAFDITDEYEEPDPFSERFGAKHSSSQERYGGSTQSGSSKYCPYCGTKVEGDYKYCSSCGRELPR